MSGSIENVVLRTLLAFVGDDVEVWLVSWALNTNVVLDEWLVSWTWLLSCVHVIWQGIGWSSIRDQSFWLGSSVWLVLI